jgi:hypothetical protein
MYYRNSAVDTKNEHIHFTMTQSEDGNKHVNIILAPSKASLVYPLTKQH